MRISRLLVSVLLGFGTIVSVLSAQTPQVFGYVDVAETLAFHPLMAKMSVKEGRFDLSALGDGAPKNRDQARQELESKREQLLKRKQTANKGIDDLDKSFQEDLRGIADLQARLNALPPTARTPLLNEYNRKKGIIDRKYWKRRSDLQEGLKLVDYNLEEMKQENEVLHLTNMEETQKAFKLMLDDVYQAIDAVAEHYKVSFVFNSSFSLDRSAQGKSISPENTMAQFFGMTLEGTPDDILYKHGKEGRPPMFMGLRYWTGAQRWAYRNCYDPRLDKMFIKGGVNMTPAVVDFVYQKYKVDSIHSQVIQKFLEYEARNY